MSPKVATLPFHVVTRMIELAEDAGAAREVSGHTSPLASRIVPELPGNILVELRKMTPTGDLNCYVRLQSDEDAAALSSWCRKAALRSPVDAKMLRTAADTIDNSP